MHRRVAGSKRGPSDVVQVRDVMAPPRRDVEEAPYVDPYEEHEYRAPPEDPEKQQEIESILEGGVPGHLTQYHDITERPAADLRYAEVRLPYLDKLTPEAADVIRENEYFRAVLATLRLNIIIPTRDELDCLLTEAGLTLDWKEPDDIRQKTNEWTALPVLQEERIHDDDDDIPEEDDDEMYMDIQHRLRLANDQPDSFEKDEEIVQIMEDHFRVILNLQPLDQGKGWYLKAWHVALI